MHIYLLPSDNKRFKARLKGSMQLLLTPSDNVPTRPGLMQIDKLN